ncbi:putative gtpase activating protein [Cladorrhinum samala]|uniref:Gtpase activating protein n=1 Tax=Cladorrhinum samala TaxID=585594 RepID=A0AAV9I007_9PEZI|nr:putative gtpase activating protein [Cladorrhinum samala]
MVWDKGFATSPRAIAKRPSARDLRSLQTSWRRVSCILHDNGELKLMTENDVTVLAVIELPQLARSAIQLLDKSVLDEDYCLAVFPIYSSTSTKLSIFRPLYISLESRVLFEVWFVLLRAFTVPDIYYLDSPGGGQVYEVTDFNIDPPGEIFRLEKTISVRVTEAKFRGRTIHSESATASSDRYSKPADHDIITGNYLAEVVIDGEVRARTTTKMNTKKPFWREDCHFVDLPASLPYLSILLKRVDGNMDSFAQQLQATLGLTKPNSVTEMVCGSVDIPLHQLERGKDHEQWFQICDERQQSVGSMLVKVHHEELVVLLSEHYKPLSDLLHLFSSGLTAQITEAVPGNLRRLAEILLNIFQVSGSASDWLKNMVEDEIDGVGTQATLKQPRFSSRLKSSESLESTSDREQLVRDMGKSLQGEANLLFRGNSLLTQALEFHMRRLGKEYLLETLADKISEINELNPDCEVDPSKLQNGEDINQHWTQLMQLTNELWGCIALSATRLPTELRQILKYIRAVAEDRYGDFLRTVTYTSVSGFLFLRFLCPAILNPKLFGLLRDHPRPRAQRALTLIAKGLQALGNLSTIGKKETWMEPMNRFLTAQRQAFKDFLDAVCAVPADQNKVTLQASYSTPITIMGRLPPIAREGFPSLPYLLDNGQNFAALVKLWMDAHLAPSGETRAYQGDLLQFHRLCVGLYQRSKECYTRIENLRAADTSSQYADDRMSLTEALERLSFGDAMNMSSYSSSTAVYVDSEGRPPGSSGSDLDSGATLSPGGSRDAIRFGPTRDPNASRQVSRSSEMSGQSAGVTVRGLRNGIHPRKLLSGFIRKTRTALPDDGLAATTSPPGGTMKDRERERDRDREKDHERDGNRARDRIRDRDRDRDRDQDRDRDRNKSGVLPEMRQGETVDKR